MKFALFASPFLFIAFIFASHVLWYSRLSDVLVFCDMNGMAVRTIRREWEKIYWKCIRALLVDAFLRMRIQFSTKYWRIRSNIRFCVSLCFSHSFRVCTIEIIDSYVVAELQRFSKRFTFSSLDKIWIFFGV